VKNTKTIADISIINITKSISGNVREIKVISLGSIFSEEEKNSEYCI